MKHCAIITALIGWCAVIGTDCLVVVLEDSLTPIEDTVRTVLTKWPIEQTNVRQLATSDRESFAVAKKLNERLCAFRRNGDCGRCWLQQAHCICQACQPLELVNTSGIIEESPDPLATTPVNRIFVLMHHKEICLAVDTAKLIVASLPVSARIVVGGISEDFQESMKAMRNCITKDPSSCMVLFPSDQAKTYSEITQSINEGNTVAPKAGWNVIVVDGTWEQARKLYNRYLSMDANPGRPFIHVKLSDSSLASILPSPNTASENLTRPHSSSMQLRRHPQVWRQISTLAATRLLLNEMDPAKANLWDKLVEYQKVSDGAARKQLGPIRLREVKK